MSDCATTVGECASYKAQYERVSRDRDEWQRKYEDAVKVRETYRNLYLKAKKEGDQSVLERDEARVAAQHIMELGVWQRVQQQMKKRWDWLEVDE